MGIFGGRQSATRILSVVSVIIALAGCTCSRQLCEKPSGTDPKASSEPADPQSPSVSPARAYDMPRFAINSPFDTKYESPIPAKEKQLWAKSCLWEKAPDFVVEKWLTGEPDVKGRYVLIEFWATWCRQCRLTIPKLNQLHRKFGQELVVVGISDEKEQTVRSFDGPAIEYFIAIDTQAVMKDKIGVFGIPHVIILEPGGYGVWEGFPLLKGYELTEEVVGRILEAGRKARTAD